MVDPDEDYLITARGPVAGAHASHDLPQLSAVDLTVEKKCKRYTASTTDDMKIFNEQNEKEKETEMGTSRFLWVLGHHFMFFFF